MTNIFSQFFRYGKRQKVIIRAGMSVLVLTFSLILVMFILYWQSSYSLRQSAGSRLELAVSRTEQIINHAKLATGNVVRYVGMPCNADVLQTLRVQVASIPDVRTVSLIDDGIIYCSSVYGRTSQPGSKGNYAGGQILLMEGNALTPDSAVLIFRTPSPNDDRKAVLAGIDGYYIRSILALLSDVTPVYLQAGDRIMTPDGQVLRSTAIPGNEKTIIRQPSVHFPFVVFSPVTMADRWHFLYDNALGSSALLLLFSLLSGATTFWYSGKLVSPAKELQFAIDDGQLIPFIQPVVTADGRLAGGEILVRWAHPERGLLSPGMFILLAEKNSLVIPLTRSIMNQVRLYFTDIQSSLPDGFHFAFNISPEHFELPELIAESNMFLDTFADRKIHLVLEITERQPVQRDKSKSIIEQLRENGVLIALDDFGTGHSSLDYLRDFSFDFIKIDKSFVDDVVGKVHIGNIVNNIVGLADSMNIQTVAEGVESQEQLRELMQYNITYYQGYLFSRPLDLRTFSEKWLGSKSS